MGALCVCFHKAWLFATVVIFGDEGLQWWSLGFNSDLSLIGSFISWVSEESGDQWSP